MAASDDPIRIAIDWLGLSFSDSRQPRGDDDAEQRERGVGGRLVSWGQNDPDAARAYQEAEDQLTDQKDDRLTGRKLMLGIEADHDDERAITFLEELYAWLNTHPMAPLLAKRIVYDCMMAPPERGGHHWEIITFVW